MKKTLLIALTLFVTWNFVAIWLPDPPTDAPNLWNRNLITAERILYDVESLGDKAVVLGSSHAAGLVFKDNILNLALAGLSIHDGHMVLAMRRDTPQSVWIEANVIQRPPNADFARKFSAVSKLRQFLPAMRTRNQPVAVLHRGYDWVRPRLKAAILNRPVADDHPKKQIQPPPSAALIDDPRWKTPVDQNRLVHAIARLRDLIDRLSASDVKVAFFEMPQHPAICESIQMKSIRHAIKTEFPDIPYLDHPKCTDYQTSDGLHLTRMSAERYSQYLQSKMTKFNSLEHSN